MELLISVLLISAMLGALWTIFRTGLITFYGTEDRQNIFSQTSNAFTVMTNELHQATSITAASGSAVTFIADLNSDGVNETIQYTWSTTAGNPLNRVSGAQTVALIRSINNPPPLSTTPVFHYYGANNTDLGTSPTLSSVRLIQIEVYTTSGSESFHLRTKVMLRCI
jgi:hypothetical protein